VTLAASAGCRAALLLLLLVVVVMLGRVVVMVMVMVSFASDDELYLGHARRHRVEHVAALRQRQLCTPAATTYRPSLQNKLAATEDRSHTDRVTILANPSPNHWPCPVTLTFNLRRAMVMTHTHATTRQS